MATKRSGVPARVRSSFYDVLGVPTTAGEEEIRARYLLLIRRYHPDLNRSPLAHVRAAEITEAFHGLSDAALRERHDAELAQRNHDAALRAAGLGGTRALVRRRPRSPWRRYGAQLGLIALLLGTAVAAWQIQRRLPVAAPAGAGESLADSEARRAVAALNAASQREARDMPPVSAAVVANAAEAFRGLAGPDALSRARAFSERCHADANTAGSWEALDFCVAFDHAAYRAQPGGRDAYFMDRHDRAAGLYVAKLSSMDAIGVRLGRIRAQVAPRPPHRFAGGTIRALRRFAEGKWTVDGAVRKVFDPANDARVPAATAAQDF